MSRIIVEKFDEGQDLYRNGTSLFEVAAIINAGFDAGEDDRSGSIMLGFAEGLIGDIRKIASRAP